MDSCWPSPQTRVVHRGGAFRLAPDRRWLGSERRGARLSIGARPIFVSASVFRRINSLRFQIAAIPSGILIVWLAATFTFMVADARERIQSEVASSTAMARAMMEGAVASLQQGLDPAEAFDRLSRVSPHVRHVRIALASAPRESVGAGVIPEPKAQAEAPGWFMRLIGSPHGLETMELRFEGRPLGYVLIAPNPADEIDEIWRDFLYLTAISVIATVATAAAIFLMFARTLRPIRALGAGLERLEQGDYKIELAPARLEELEPIRDRFNRLANSLLASEAENRMLYQRVVSLAEAERKGIARELHDELGPCLFGIRAETASIVKIAASLAPEGTAIPQRAKAINDVVDAMQQIIRRVLEALRPVTLAEFGLAAALRELVDNWQERNPDAFIALYAADADVDGIDEPVALAVYRIVQECLTNVARHASAETAEIVVERQPANEACAPGNAHSDAPVDEIHVQVRDNGTGFAIGTRRGLGLRGVEERARGVGGRVAVASEPDEGVAVDAWLPVTTAES